MCEYIHSLSVCVRVGIKGMYFVLVGWEGKRGGDMFPREGVV